MNTESDDPIRERADRLVKLIKERKNIELEYSLFSLLYIDKLLDEMFGEDMERIKDPQFDNLRTELGKQLGCFYGECLRASLNGVWENDEKYGVILTRIGNQNLTALPFSTASSRMDGDKGKIFASAMAITSQLFTKVRDTVYT